MCLPADPYAFTRSSKDASNVGLGAVLAQLTKRVEQPIFFLSWKLSSAEQKYVAIEKEAPAMGWAIEECKYYLWGHLFTIIMDHAPLQWLHQMKDSNPCLLRWYLALQLYHFKVCYRRGQDHLKADFFSQQMVWNALDQQAGLGGGGASVTVRWNPHQNICSQPERAALYRGLAR